MTLPQADYTLLTPYLLPPDSPKKVNVGDGFIMDSVEKLIGLRASAYYSVRAQLTDAAIARINASRFLLVAGANTLRDDWSLTPDCKQVTLARIKVPIVLMGLGHYGVAEATRGMRPEGVAQIAAILERFHFMSVRCDRSREYLVKSAPQLADKILMTSCPVAYPVDGIDRGFARKAEYELMAVTITDRVNLQQQLPILIYSARCFRSRRKVLALHQDYGNAALHDFARQQGYDVFASPRVEDALDLYKNVDLHVGNRVHGHLKALSLGAASFLLPFDLRQAYFAESMRFPLITELPSPEFDRYDFRAFATRRAEIAPVMERFVSAVRELLQ